MIDKSTLVFAAIGTLAVGFLMTVRQWPGMQVPAVVGAAATLWFYGKRAWAERNTDVSSIAQHVMVVAFVLSVPLRAFGSGLGIAAMLLAVLGFFLWLAMRIK